MIIGRLHGQVAAVGVDSVMIDVGGVGYVALAGPGLLARLHPGETAELHIETLVTENAITLYAFETDAARAWFTRLRDVPGVGGKAALAVVDSLSPSELMDALALQDVAMLSRPKGVGKKLAERIAGELSGKPPPLGRFASAHEGAAASPETPAPAMAEITGGPRGEAVSALTNLGYGQAEAARAVATVLREAKQDDGEDVGALIKAALKELSPA